MLSRLLRVLSGPERPLSTQGCGVYEKYYRDEFLEVIYNKVLEFIWKNLRLEIGGTEIQEEYVLEAFTGLRSYKLSRDGIFLTVRKGCDVVMEMGKYMTAKTEFI
ncbi:unnamed protein product [Angiostrongylus costaricensis]|uniref:Archease domain-containing protein n=1 Tax=Angiostrongylus costaricensis TaxID=334426 RepID=A0A158PFH2_ANGCS|nr:unnamed protein product [Angiostrongylus costaricensis]